MIRRKFFEKKWQRTEISLLRFYQRENLSLSSFFSIKTQATILYYNLQLQCHAAQGFWIGEDNEGKICIKIFLLNSHVRMKYMKVYISRFHTNYHVSRSVSREEEEIEREGSPFLSSLDLNNNGKFLSVEKASCVFSTSLFDCETSSLVKLCIHRQYVDWGWNCPSCVTPEYFFYTHFFSFLLPKPLSIYLTHQSHNFSGVSTCTDLDMHVGEVWKPKSCPSHVKFLDTFFSFFFFALAPLDNALHNICLLFSWTNDDYFSFFVETLLLIFIWPSHFIPNKVG